MSEWIYVLDPVPVRDPADMSRIAGTLQPGTWYSLTGVEGAWAHIADASGTLEGWVPADSVHRPSDAPAPTPMVKPSPSGPPTTGPVTPPRSGIGRLPQSALVGLGLLIIVAIWAFPLVSDGADDSSDTAERTGALAASVSPTTTPTTTASPPATSTSTMPPTTTEATNTTVATTTTATTTVPVMNLTVGHWVAFAPFQQRDDSGQLSGFEIDLLEVMADRMNAAFTWVEVDHTGMVDGVSSGTFDLAAGRITIDSLSDIAYTRPHFNQQFALIVDPNAPQRVEAFSALTGGHMVAVSRGSEAEDWARASLASVGVEVLAFDSVSDAIASHRSGEAHAVVSALFFPSVAAGRYPPLLVADTTPTGRAFGFGVDPRNDDLRAALDGALTAIIEDRTYEEIYDRWFAVPAGSVTP